MSMFASFLIAGFECARLHWQEERCMLTSTGHVPEASMREHYRIVKAHGMRTVRDGLPWWLPIEPRLQIARESGLEVIWDLNHWWKHPSPTDYAKRVAMAVLRVCPDQPFWCCFNETLIHPFMRPGQSREEVTAEAELILGILRYSLFDVRLITSEPGHSSWDIGAHAALAPHAVALGLNFYPHHGGEPLSEILRNAAERYPGKPLLITETGLHAGYDDRWARPDLFPRELTKAQWLRRVLAEIEASGVPVEGVCLYPIVNGTDWHAGGHSRYDNGLIREDLSVDPDLSAAIKSITGEPA